MDEGTLFRTTETAFVQTKRKLLNECNLWCIVSLPAGVFINAGAASKTNLLFFTKGQETKEVWYYDLSDLKATKKQPLAAEHFEEFFKLLPEQASSERSWSVSVEELKAKNYDLKAINPNQKHEEDTPTPEELLSFIEAQGAEISTALSALRDRALLGHSPPRVTE